MTYSSLIAIAAAVLGTMIGALVTLWANRRLATESLRDFEVTLKQVNEQVDQATIIATSVEDRSDEKPGTALQEKDLAALPAVRASIDSVSRRIDSLERRSRVLDTRRFALLQTYHNQGLAQSRVSFWFSLVLATAGFAVIVVATYNFATDQSSASTPLPFIAGAITEAVSVLFFAQSNQARRLMQNFFSTLSEDQRREEALNLADSVDDPILRSAVKAAIAMQLIDSKVSPAILPGFESSSRHGVPKDNDIDGTRSDQRPSAS